MRPEAVRTARDHVYKVLWTHPDHELVVSVREEILKKYDQTAQEISTGNLLVGNRLTEVLEELGTNGSRILAAVLWALNFKGPDAEALFRCIAPLAQDGTSRQPDQGVTQDNRQAELEAKLRSAVRDMKEAQRTADRALHDLQAKQRKLEKSMEDLEEARHKQRETAAELDRVQALVREADATIRGLERDGERAAKANADVRRDLKQAQKDQRTLDSERGELAAQVATERRAVERLKLELASVPRGPDAVMAFLQAEEKRIQLERSITSGGDRIRADREWTAHRKIESAFLGAYEQYRQPPPVRIRKRDSLRLVALGGSGEIGRSCYLIELGKHRILVDCGIKPSAPEGDMYPAIDRLEHIDALVLTHAHTDHIGWVPALIHKLGEVNIYCSRGTAALLPVMLEDGYTHYVRKKQVQRELAQRIHNADPVEDEYNEKDVFDASRFASRFDFDEEEGLPFGDISITLFRAGHILGAASVLIQDKSGRRIFLSGDFSSFQQLTVPAARWPNDPEEIDLLVLESTYGDSNHPPLDDSRRELVSFVHEITEVRKGSVILASFGLGRAQELLKLIGMARERGELSASVPVHVDGMIRRINPIYRNLAQFELPPEAFNEVSGEAERREIAHRAQDVPSIIVTTSGMLTGGPVVEYARRLLPDPRHRIVLTGFQDEGAPGRGLLTDLTGPGRSARIVRVRGEDGELVEFEAAMPAKEVKLSSHADQAGLMEYAGRLRPKSIALVHGRPEAQQVLRSLLLTIHPRAEISCGPPDVVVP